jgi:elongator complex protein 3
VTPPDFDFDPLRHERELSGIVEALRALDGPLDQATFERILGRFPRDGRAVFSKSQIVRGVRALAPGRGWDEGSLLRRLRRKPTRTLSGVTPVAVLTRPHPCPGFCVFCPNDARMPKSYLSLEPAAQRADRVRFDPYLQTWLRLKVFHNNGHGCEKVELIVLGGTWSSYPRAYRRWFVARCLEAMNDFGRDSDTLPPRPDAPPGAGPGANGADRGGGSMALSRTSEASYNRRVSAALRARFGGRLEGEGESASWSAVRAAQRENESARCRCVGLSVETRPDEVTADEVLFARRIGCTKVQIGYQSLSDEILRRNRRGHDVEAARAATGRLRRAGFKIHGHWMPNLLGADPRSDRADFERLFSDPGLHPDELKIYPCSLVPGTELVRRHEAGEWRPYGDEELIELIADCLRRVPRSCRVTRVIRDFSAADIVAGSRTSNLRQLVERRMGERGWRSRDIRAREVRDRRVRAEELELREERLETPTGSELFLEWVTADDRLAGFARLGLPAGPAPLAELERCALVREVHVYGAAADLGARGDHQTQHLGLGRRLIDRAAELAGSAGFERLAVISAIGTRAYYRGLHFADGELYQSRQIGPTRRAGGPQETIIGR